MLSNPAAQEDSQVTPEGLQLTEVVFVVRHVIGNQNYPTTEKIKVQRLQPSMPSVSQGSGCGITLFWNCANHPHKTFPKRTLLS